MTTAHLDAVAYNADGKMFDSQSLAFTLTQTGQRPPFVLVGLAECRDARCASEWTAYLTREDTAEGFECPICRKMSAAIMEELTDGHA